MIQNYHNDPLYQNYMAPCYPIFIQIKYLLTNISGKKSVRNAKNDILNVVLSFYLSSSAKLAQMDKDLSLLLC